MNPGEFYIPWTGEGQIEREFGLEGWRLPDEGEIVQHGQYEFTRRDGHLCVRPAAHRVRFQFEINLKGTPRRRVMDYLDYWPWMDLRWEREGDYWVVVYIT